ncbi:MAG: recombinase RecT [Prevotellaceae bacterium]|jgi:recombinational DNA repair protein RecT|nr:recombinase RecT [Prevotellaceae bacterium]
MENNSNKKIGFEDLKPTEIANDNNVRKRFIEILTTIQKLSEAEAASIYEREALYFTKAVKASDRLPKCTNISLYSAFLEIAVTGLSIQSGSKSEAYIESRGANTGKKDEKGNDIWINSAMLQVTAYGELNMSIRSGQIVRMSNPIVLYDGDVFQPHTTPRGELTVDYKPAIPRTSGTIIGCWVAITLPGNGIDFKWLLQDDIERLKKASIPKTGNNKVPSALYSSNGGQIDTGFLEAKTIKHAMRAYTKLRVGDGVSFEDDMPDAEAEDATFAVPENEQARQETVTFDNTDDNEGEIF